MSNSKVLAGLSAEQLKQVIDNLKAAKLLIITEDKWCQKTPARNKYGESCSPSSEQAVSMCAVSAINTACNGFNKDLQQSVEYRLMCEVCNTRWFAIDYNDTHTHAEVLAKFDEAIELACVDLINMQ